ncbi:hypothetical protein OK074_4572 [Actinobacteria bacterium OK074]|nr:hypothetical protein OK074_4572 [Actinobacteria bacterium OK074]
MTAERRGEGERHGRRGALVDGTAVRRLLGLGRLLPLGGPADGAWITEGAAGTVLRQAANGVPGVRPGPLRIALADPDETYGPAVPLPPSALPPGPLRIGAEFAATADPSAPDAEPLPATAARLRVALAAAAEGLGLRVSEIDLRVTGVVGPVDSTDPTGPTDSADLTDPVDPVDGSVPEPGSGTGGSGGSSDEAAVAAAALAVPGVVRLTGALGGLGRAVHIDVAHIEARQDGTATAAAAAALPRRHVRIEVAVGAAGRALDVARGVRAAVSGTLPDRPSVAVLVTKVEG